MRAVVVLLGLLVPVSFALAFSPLAVAPPAEIPPDFVAETAAAQKIDTLLTRLVPFGYSGSALVAGDGQVLLNKGYGLADRENGTANTSQTVHSIGSVTKQFTAAAIMKLVQARKLSTDDTLSRYFPEAPADKRDITLHQMLTHTSGITNYTGGDYEPATREQMIETALSTPLDFEPGTRFQYSNSPYSLLAAIVEKVDGRPYEQYLREELFAPAGMTDTGYTLEWEPARLAHAYSGERHTPPNPLAKAPRVYPSWNVMGNGEILSTTADLYRWHLALEGDAILSDASRERLYTPNLEEYAYGWRVQQTPRGRLISHGGGSDTGTRTMFARNVDADAVLVLFQNSDDLPTNLVAEMIEKLLFGEEVQMPPAASGRADVELQPGTYLADGGAEMRVEPGPNGAVRVAAVNPEAQVALALPGTSMEHVRERMAVTERITQFLLEGEGGDASALEGIIADEARAARMRDFMRRVVQESGFKPTKIAAVAVAPSNRPFGDLIVFVEFADGENVNGFAIYWKGDQFAAASSLGPPDISATFVPNGPAYIAYLPELSRSLSLLPTADGNGFTLDGGQRGFRRRE